MTLKTMPDNQLDLMEPLSTAEENMVEAVLQEELERVTDLAAEDDSLVSDEDTDEYNDDELSNEEQQQVLHAFVM